MGQYFRVVNIDKQEQLVPWDFRSGSKLMEWSYQHNKVVNAMTELLADRWKGDRVIVVGDYADYISENDTDYAYLANIWDEIGTDNIYSYADKNYKFLKAEDVNVADTDYRFIYNHATGEFIDLTKLPIEAVGYDEESAEGWVRKISPLPLLLAVGNDLGGGGFCDWGNGYEFIGSWCETSTDIDISKEFIEEYADYDEFAPDFTENEKLIPYTEEKRLIEKVEQENNAVKNQEYERGM